MMRLASAPLGGLRRVVALESAVPLLAVAAVAIGTGFGVSAMYATMQLAHPLACCRWVAERVASATGPGAVAVSRRLARCDLRTCGPLITARLLSRYSAHYCYDRLLACLTSV